MKKFKDKYNIKSMRAAWHDYGADGLYFITIHTAGPSFYFGDVRNKKTILSDSGLISKKCWLEIPIHFPYARLGEFIIMPNHIHGIIKIQKEPKNAKTISPNDPFDNPDSSPNFPVQTRFIASHDVSQAISSSVTSKFIPPLSDTTQIIESQDTLQFIPPPDETPVKPGGFSEQKNPMININIPRVVRWFKGRTTWEIRRIDAGFAWHSGYYDHIVKNFRELREIAYYIRNNPEQWMGK